MPDSEEREAGAEAERQRCLRVIDRFKVALGGMYIPIRNRIANPDYDPGADDFSDDRLEGF